MKASCIFPNVSDKAEPALIFQALVEAIAEAKVGKVTITMTKESSWCNTYYPQFRVWKGNFHLGSSGTHVDGFGESGVFEAHAPSRVLEGLVKEFFGKKLRRFEDELYVVWV